MQLKKVDVVICGGGWTGLAMAKELATRTSLEVVVLERGPTRTLAEYAVSMDEVDYSLRLRMMQSTADETLTHRHSTKDVAAPVRRPGHVRIGTGTGGSGEHWSGFACRYPEDTFTLKTALKERFGNARMPEGLAAQDWTVTWKDIEPYYTRVEALIGVGGKAGNIQGRRIEGGNIFEGPRSKEFPVGPHRKSETMTVFEKAAQALGFHPYVTAAATLPFDYKNPDGVFRPGCAYCGYCGLYGCMVSAKAQPTNVLLPVLRRKSNFTIRNNAWVRRILHKDGRATGVTYMDEKGREITQPASIVVTSSFPTGNARLLLLSQIGTAYNPATGEGTLGRNFTHQMSGGSSAQIVFDKPLQGYARAGGQGMSFSDFDSFNRLDPDAGIIRGGTFVGGGGGSGLPISSFGNIPAGEVSRNWGADWKKAALKYHDRIAGTARLEAEHLPYKQNYVDLDPTYTDKWGDPLLRTTIDWTDHEMRVRAFATKICNQMAKEIASIGKGRLVQGGGRGDGRRSGRYQTADYATTHLHGGAIMSDTPADGVVNTYLQHWNLPNLWVVGASAFPHAGSTNPTLTALAFTLRAADALIDKYLKHPGALV